MLLEFNTSQHSTYIQDTLERLKNELPFSGWFLAGGFALAYHEPTSSTVGYGDIDVFFESEEAFVKALEYHKRFADISRESKYAVTFQDNVQLICHRFGTAQEILSDFDINVCRVAYTCDGHWIDMRGENPKQIKILNPKYYGIIDRIRKYLYRGCSIDLSELIYLRELVTTEGLDNTDMYGEEVNGILDASQFFNKISQIKPLIGAEVYYKLFEDFDFLEVILATRSVQGFVLSYNIGWIAMDDLPYAVNTNQKYAIMHNNFKLTGSDLADCMKEYPEYFI